MLSETNVPSFEQIVAQFDQKIYALCWYLLKNKPDAQDCTQDIFIAIFQALPQLKNQASLRSWIYQISVRKCY
ncbi:MAG: RNA polymerase sigma factor, partial [Sphingomonadales bacterium]